MIRALLTCLCFPTVILYQTIKALHRAINNPRSKKRPKQTIIIKPQTKPPATLNTARDQDANRKKQERLLKLESDAKEAQLTVNYYAPIKTQKAQALALAESLCNSTTLNKEQINQVMATFGDLNISPATVDKLRKDLYFIERKLNKAYYSINLYNIEKGICA